MRQPVPVQKLDIDQDTVRYWRGEIEASKKRQKEEFIDRIGYDELIRYFEGQQAEASRMKSMAIMDEMSPAVASVVRSVMYQIPTVNVTAEHPLAEEQVKPSLEFVLANPAWKPFSRIDLMKGSVQYAMKKADFKEEFQIGAFDVMMAGFICIEANHAVVSQDEAQAEQGTEPSPAEKPNPLLEGAVGVLRQGFNGLKKALTNQDVADEVEADQPQERTDATDATYVKRWSPMDIFFDADAIVFKESRFIAKRVRMSLAKFNNRYPKFKGQITASSEALENVPFKGSMSEKNRKAVVLYEIEIKKSSGRNCVLVIANGIQEAIDYYESPIITNGFKIKYGCLDKYGRIYPMSRAKKAKKPQDDINHYMTTQFEHVDRAQRKIGVFMEGLGPGGESAVKSADVYAIVPKKVPTAIFEAMPAPSVVPENKEIVSAMRESINKVIGTNEIAKTGQSENDLATQDVLENKSFETNTSAVQDAIGDVAKEVLDTIKDIILQLWDNQDYFRVTGISGGQFWYDPSMGPLTELLVGDYGIEVDIQSAARPNPMRDRQDALELAKFLTSGDIQAYLQVRGKMTNMAPIDNVIKQYNQSPDVIIQDLNNPLLQPAPTLPPAPSGSGVPPPPGAGPLTPAPTEPHNQNGPRSQGSVLRAGA